MPNEGKCPLYGDDAEFIYCKGPDSWNKFFYGKMNKTVGRANQKQLSCDGQTDKCQDAEAAVAYMAEAGFFAE